jgi:hypothetical protein
LQGFYQKYYYVETAARVSHLNQLDPSPKATTGLPAAPSETYIKVPVSTVGSEATVYVGNGIPTVLFAAVDDLILKIVFVSYTVPTSSPESDDVGISINIGFAIAGLVICAANTEKARTISAIYC